MFFHYFLFLSNKTAYSTGIICYISMFLVSFYKFNQILPHKTPNITPYIIIENSIFATEKFKMRCETLIIIFYLYKKQNIGAQ